MRTVSIRLCDMERTCIPIGFVGENLYTRVRIDSKVVFDEYPTAIASLTVQDPNGSMYPGFISRDGDVIIWDVTASDLVYGGNGALQLAFFVDDVIAKSYICRTYVSKAMIGPGTIPTPIASWIDAANVVLGEAEEVFEALDNMTVAAKTLAAGSTATAEISDVDGHKHIYFGIPQGDQGERGETGPAGRDGTDGADGFSPTLVVSTITGGHRITITDKVGTQTVDVLDGEKGETGATGNGIASVVLNQDYTLTITYTNGNSYTTTSIRGEKGEPGDAPIDDTSTAADRVWSAQKVNELKSAIDKLTPDATASDVGKAIIVKTVADGKPTSYEYGEAGGGGVDPQDIEDAVDAWLTENITNPDSPPLDRSLSSSSAAAPADLMGAIANLQSTQKTGLLSPFVQGNISNGVIDPTATTHCYIGPFDVKKNDTISYSRYSSDIAFTNVLVLYNSDGTFDKNVNLTNPTDYTFTSDGKFAVVCSVNTGKTLANAITAANNSFTVTLSEESAIVKAVKAVDGKIEAEHEEILEEISPQLIGITNYADMSATAKSIIKSVVLYDPDPTKVYCLVVLKVSQNSTAKFEIYSMTSQMGYDTKVCSYNSTNFDGRSIIKLTQENASGISAEISFDWSTYTSIDENKKYVIDPSAYKVNTIIDQQDVLMPNNIYVADGHPAQFFPKNLLSNRTKDTSGFYSMWYGYSDSTKLGENVINFPYSSAGADVSISLKHIDPLSQQNNTFGSKTIHVNPVSVDTPYSIKILTIGDSFMDYPWYTTEAMGHSGRGVMAFIKDYAETDGNTVDFIGTHLSYTDDGDDYYSESYGGWMEEYFVDNTQHSYEGSQIYSPFCINGTACDFANYFTALGETPDIVVFFLGMNGNYSATNGEAIQTMITGIKAVSANTKFIVCTVPPYYQNRYLYNYAYRNADLDKYNKNKMYYTRFDGQESNGIYMVPINAMFSAEYHYITANEAILNYNTDVKMPICRNHHPNKTGVQMIADAIYSVIQAIMA